MRIIYLPGGKASPKGFGYLYHQDSAHNWLFKTHNSGWWTNFKIAICLIAASSVYGAVIGLGIGVVRWLGSQLSSVILKSIIEGSLAGAFVGMMFGISILLERRPAANDQRGLCIDSRFSQPDSAMALDSVPEGHWTLS